MRTSMMAILSCLAMVTTASLAGEAQQDEAAIRAVFVGFTQSWMTPGMPGFEDLFAPDADFVVITGKRLTGQPEIVTYHRELLKTAYKDFRRQTMKVETIRFLTPDIAIAHVASGGTYVRDGQEHTRTALATATLIKNDKGWLITAFHNTLTSGPGAAVPAPRN